VNRGTPIINSDDYRDRWADCQLDLVGAGDVCAVQPGSLVSPTNQVMRDAIAQDPDAYWDAVSSSVQGSQFAQSPRIIFFPVHDPRVPLSAVSQLRVTKIIAFFMEQMTGNARVRGRFLRAIGTGQACPD